MAPAEVSPGQAAARELVEAICKERGYVSEHHLSQMTPEIRRVVEDALLRKDEMIGSAVMTLARNLYTSSARFVFELLQNADDNNYTKATARGEEPFVSFDIHCDKIIIECNEDGFTKENITAICAIGKSSKTGAQGYIGEKGIGFKSVFMAAWRVHIQSNDFSFAFTHRKDGSGLGMVTPHWTDPDGDITDGRTRITLQLHEHDDPAENTRQANTIRTQFRDLQDTILLFLRKLRRIQITEYSDANDSFDSRSVYSLHGSSPVTIRKVFTGPDGDTTTEKIYHVTKHLAQNVPKSENRSYSEDEARIDATAEVVLAFPVTAESVPIVEDQDVFAFLPMRPMGFKFLMHTDFVTEASRQGIVTTSLRNQALRDGIAECLVKAIEKFCQHTTIQYQWIKWLPQRESYPWDAYWNGFINKIEERIKTVNILRTLGIRQLRPITEVRRVMADFTDHEGNPVFPDTTPEIYIAREYEDVDLLSLMPYGLKNIAFAQATCRVELDLSQPEGTSWMKSPPTSEAWHSRAAAALSWMFNSAAKLKLTTVTDKLQSLKLIPLEDSSWISAKEAPIYYPDTPEGLVIPQGLHLKLVSRKAVANADRCGLFDILGVKKASVGFIRNSIANQPAQSKANDTLLSTAVEYLRFLYLTQLNTQDDNSPNFTKYHVYDRNLTYQSPRSGFGLEVLIPTSHQYGPSELLKGLEGRLFGYKPIFVHDKYLEDEPARPEGCELSWIQWLEEFIGLSRDIKLYYYNGLTQKHILSEAFKYVMTCQPQVALGALQHLWSLEEKTPPASILEELCAMKVRCKDGHHCQLSDSYLPLPELEAKWARYAIDEKFHFLHLEEPVVAGSYRPQWGFLIDHLAVGDTDNFIFYLDMLRVLKKANEEKSMERATRVLDLYEMIQARCNEADDPAKARTLVRDIFNIQSLVFIPPDSEEDVEWVNHECCLWETGGSMSGFFSVRLLYATDLDRPAAQLDTLERFFHNTLEIPDADQRHYIKELRILSARKEEEPDFEWISWIYDYLDSIGPGLDKDEGDGIKKAFADEPLTYALVNNKSGWYKTSECLWSSATTIQGRVALNDLYPELEDFFVDFLGVQELTVQMAYEELKEKGSREPPPPIEEVKETIWAINSLLQSAEVNLSHAAVLNSRIFPIRFPNGRAKLHTARAQFAIQDRKALGDIFRPQAKFLDFTFDEVRRLQPFIEWLRLDTRYLSAMVKEISTVDGGEMTRLRHPDRDIRRKAQGLYRIAVHFNSPRCVGNDLSLYHILRKAEVYETDGISSELHLSQDGHDYVHEQERSELHIREDDGVLKVYVPHDQKSQGFCYYSRLPPRFLEWLMTEPTTQSTNKASQSAIRVVSSILTAPLMNVTQILEAEGIVEADFPEGEDVDEDDDPERVVAYADALPSQRQPVLGSTSPSRVSGITALGGFSPPRTQVQPTRDTSIVLPETTEYIELLNSAISSASKTIFPSSGGTFDMSGLQGALPSTSGTEDRSDSSRRLLTRIPSERDKKMGAAGELYVFELLSRHLPDFSRDNWESTIRDVVSVHPDYTNLEPWHGFENSDFIYRDRGSKFTELLITHGYLPRATWTGKTPFYHIEVKTTTSAVNTQFYMSKHQFQRMQQCSASCAAPDPSPAVYIIFRVYRIDNPGATGLKIYVNPDELRKSGSLVFSEENYAVTPGKGVE